MMVRRPYCVTVSMMTLRLGSSRRTRKIEVPPMPSSGFRITSPCSARNSRIGPSLRVATEGAMNCVKCAIPIFSL